MALLLTSLNRLYSTTQLGTDKIKPRFLELARSKGLDRTLADTFIGGYRHLAERPVYRKCCAVLDMFLSRIPSHKWSIIRFGTVSSRHRDCALLVAYADVAKMIGLTPAEMATWLWTRQLGMEAKQIFRPGNEVEKSNSYMPYMKDLQLVTRSPYSVTVNPNLQFFIHAVGCAIQSERSVNAIFNERANVYATMHNAMFLARRIMLINTTSLKSANKLKEEEDALEKKMKEMMKAGLTDDKTPPNVPPREDPDEEFDLTKHKSLPKAEDSESWFNYYKENSFIIPDEVQIPVYKRWLINNKTRPGTVGEFLYKKAKCFLEQ